jgi:hypothetical protein
LFHGVHDSITINYGDKVIPLSLTLLVGYVWLIRFVHHVLAKCKEYALAATVAMPHALLLRHPAVPTNSQQAREQPLPQPSCSTP